MLSLSTRVWLRLKYPLKFQQAMGVTSTFAPDTSDSQGLDTVLSEGSPTVRSESVPSKRVPLTVDEFRDLKSLKPCQPDNPHLLKVSILGEPNVGKSTLTNSLVKWKVCAVSSKVHTTRKRASAVLIEDNKQIVFLDTPGLVTPEKTKRHSLEASFVMDPLLSVREADIVAVVVDISNRYTNNRINENVLEVLENFKHKKSILVLNKMDAMKSKSRVLSLTRVLTGGCVAGLPVTNFEKDIKVSEEPIHFKDIDDEMVSPKGSSDDGRGWPHFEKVFVVSALKSDGVEDLRAFLWAEARPGPWIFPENAVTDQHPHEIAVSIVREKLLEYLPHEIPYTLDLRIHKWSILFTGCPKIDIRIKCLNSRHKRFVIGPEGKHIGACADRARRAMRESFRTDVVLHLAVV